MQSLQNGLQPHSEAILLFPVRTGPLASSQSCHSVVGDASCKRGLMWVPQIAYTLEGAVRVGRSGVDAAAIAVWVTEGVVGWGQDMTRVQSKSNF